MSNGARAHDDLDVKLAACHSACASAVSSAAFRAKRVPGLQIGMHGLGQNKWSDVLFYVEVRHLTQGLGDIFWNSLMRCDCAYCNKDDQNELCPQSTADAEPVVQFPHKWHFALQNEARRTMKERDTAHDGRDMKDIVQGQQESVILQIWRDEGDVDVDVAVHWVALNSSRSAPIEDRWVGWPFMASVDGLLLGFQHLLNAPTLLEVKQFLT